jgi:hypothetical protein
MNKDTTFLVGVKHYNKGMASDTYWFKASPDIAVTLKLNDWVLVDTMYGPATGRVEHNPVMAAREQDFFTLIHILGCKGTIKPVISKVDYSDNLPF